MKNYGKGFINIILLLVWAIGITWVTSRCGKPYTETQFGFSILLIMVCVIGVSHYANKKDLDYEVQKQNEVSPQKRGYMVCL